MKLVCAPMATLSHEAFRCTVERFGCCDEYFTEMIHAPSLLNGGPYERFYLQNGPVPQKIVWQLTGAHAEQIAKAAAIVAERGGIGVDVNMGCSAPQIYKTGAGIAWMSKPLHEVEALVRMIRATLKEHEARTGEHKRLSVKCRLGVEGFSDTDFFSFADALVENGVELITIHPRTQKEKYRGLPRFAYVEQLSLRYQGMSGSGFPRIPIYLNGCISDVKSAQSALKIAPHAAGLMVARAAAQKPWIFAELHAALFPANENSAASCAVIDAFQLALDFIADMERYQPPEFYRTRLQRFFSYYSQNFTFSHYFKTQLCNASSPDECRARLAEYFEKQPADRFIHVRFTNIVSENHAIG